MKKFLIFAAISTGTLLADAPQVQVLNLNLERIPVVEVFITPASVRYTGYTIAYACYGKETIFAGHAVLANLSGPTIDALPAQCEIVHVVVTPFVLDGTSQVSQ